MVRVLVSLESPPTKEQRIERQRLTTERIRALTADELRNLLEDLIQRNECTGILIHAREFVDRVAMNKIS